MSKSNRSQGSAPSEPAPLWFWSHWLVDSIIQLAVLLVLTLDATGSIASQYRVLAFMTVMLSVPLCVFLRVYSVQVGYLIGLSRLALFWGVLVSLLMFIAFITKTGELFSRQIILEWLFFSCLLQAAFFIPLKKISRRAESLRIARRRSVVVGSSPLKQRLARKLSTGCGERVVGLIAADKQREPSLNQFPTLGDVSQLQSLIRQHQISRVYITLPAEQTDQVESIYVDLLDACVDVVWVPNVANLKLLNHSIHYIGGLPALHLNESPLTSYPGSALLKTAIDRILAAVGIVVFSPVLIAAAIAVKCSSPGPILFRQKRHGWNGDVIKVLKFRSMRLHDDSEVVQAKKNDSRITAVGRFLRRSSIDELPQLFNVLKGDMSLVGPRPHAVNHNDYYADKIMAYMARHRIKPGITGLAQINGCRGETETLDKMQKRVDFDLDYINHWSVRLDFMILLKTPLSLFSKDIY